MAKIPCFLCSQELRLRRDKHNKPYFVCDPCGVQMFIRGRQGIQNLDQLIETLKEREFPFREHARVLHQVQAALTEIRGLERELESLDTIFDIFASKRQIKDKERARRSLDARIETCSQSLSTSRTQTRRAHKDDDATRRTTTASYE